MRAAPSRGAPPTGGPSAQSYPTRASAGGGGKGLPGPHHCSAVGPCCAILKTGKVDTRSVRAMSGTVAALLIGIGFLITVLVGMAAQVFGRGRRTSFTPEQAGQVPHVTHEQQEDIDAVNKSIEVSRSELLWLRDQVVKERT